MTLCCERTWKSYSLEDVGLSLAAASPACGDISAVLSSILSLTPAHVSLVLETPALAGAASGWWLPPPALAPWTVSVNRFVAIIHSSGDWNTDRVLVIWQALC